jgi:adenosylcobyric acid synthase
MPAKTLMIQGTASSVGKSILVAGFCRIFKQDGYKVAPFKAQNMSNNSFVTRENGEIGRAQAVQAEAAMIEPSIYMNPVLMKPEADNKSQIVILGKAQRTLNAEKYYKFTPDLLKVVEESLNRLREEYDIVVIEGAGSPAEINLKEREIVNMRVARMAKSPVFLAGDIDRGGVFASVVGTLQLLDQEERDLVQGIIINKFRGDLELLKPGLEMLEKIINKPVLGVVPYRRTLNIAQEDAVYLENNDVPDNGNINIAILYLPHISNYDDFDPLEKQGCNLIYIKQPGQLDNAHLIIIPGTKNTIADLEYLRNNGLADKIVKQVKKGIPILGVCGGYQMLCEKILDPHRVESKKEETAGLGLLKSTTVFAQEKHTTQVKAKVSANQGLLAGLEGEDITGYEIHMGETNSNSYVPAFKVISTPDGPADYPDGTLDNTGNVMGTYIHGLFDNTDFSAGFINRLRERYGLTAEINGINDKQIYYNELADLMRESLDMDKIYSIAGLK